MGATNVRGAARRMATAPIVGAGSALYRAKDPRRAGAYAQHPTSGANRVPFVIWMVILLGVLAAIRRGGPQNIKPSDVETYLVAGGGIVLASTVAPAFVVQTLMAMTVLAVLIDVPYLTPALDWIRGKAASIGPK